MAQHFYFPQLRVLCMAENATHNLHNILTLRGAVVRDPHMWSHYLTEAIEQYADRTDVLFASHHWPTWGTDNVRTFLESQRDLYGYIHDQTLRLPNKGLTGPEIAEAIEFPPALEGWSSRGYYGSVSHNVKAIYQRYLGWFDGNPARLWPHPPVEAAKRYVKGFGGIWNVLDQAKSAFDEGDYRWAATLLDHAVFAEPDNAEAKQLLADTFEQLGYGSENGTWRSFFLADATELRDGNFGTPTETNAPRSPRTPHPPSSCSVRSRSPSTGPEAWDLDLAIDIVLTDLDRSYRLTLRNGLLNYVERPPADDAGLRLTLTKQRLLALLAGDTTSDGLEVVGDIGILQRLQGVLDPGDKSFNIVTP